MLNKNQIQELALLMKDYCDTRPNCIDCPFELDDKCWHSGEICERLYQESVEMDDTSPL